MATKPYSPECLDEVKNYCKTITKSTTNENWFLYTGIILNVAVLVALYVFFQKMFGMSGDAINKSCKNDELERNLNNVLAAFFIVNILVQIINIMIQALTNYKGKQWTDCTKLISKEYQNKVAQDKKTMFRRANIIRILLIITVLTLLGIGLFLWNSCSKARKYSYSEVNDWYEYFHTPRQFKKETTEPNVSFYTMWYEYSDTYYELLENNASNSSLQNELRNGTWYLKQGFIENPADMLDGEQYRYESEYYKQFETTLTLSYKKDWDQKFVLEYLYQGLSEGETPFFYFTRDDATYAHALVEPEVPEN